MDKSFFDSHIIISCMRPIQSGQREKQADFVEFIEAKFRKKLLEKMGSRKNTRED